MGLQFRAAKSWVTKRVTPDYSNQLDLFSEAPLETPAPVANAPARRSGVMPARPRPQQLDFGSWEPLPPLEDTVRIPTARPTPASTGGNGEAAPPRQFERRDRFAEVGGPGVKMLHTRGAQRLGREIALQGVV